MKNFLSKTIIMFAIIGAVFTAPMVALADNEILDLDDGNYAIEATLEGGTGRSTIDSPCPITVVDGQAIATIKWSSKYYDYMIVDGKKYLPTNTEGNSTFEIPILCYDKPMAVVADTVAMSEPHEIEYTITFHKDKIMGANETPQARARYAVYMALAIIVVCIIVTIVKKQRKKKRLARG